MKFHRLVRPRERSIGPVDSRRGGGGRRPGDSDAGAMLIGKPFVRGAALRPRQRMALNFRSTRRRRRMLATKASATSLLLASWSVNGIAGCF